MRGLRSAVRGAVVLALLLAARADGWVRTVFFGMRPGAAGAVWVHGWCRRIVRAIGLVCSVEGTAPEGRVAVVSNHLSYLDILVYSATRPFVMVAKWEVRSWPLLGWITAQAGTVYVQRADLKGGRTQTHEEVNAAMAEAFRSGLPVLFFPEGTTTDGAEVLPFRRGLYHSVIRAGAPVSVAAVEYSLGGGNGDRSVANDVCYWGEMEFVPHLVGCLGLRRLGVRVRFAGDALVGEDRFALALESRASVCTAREAMAGRPAARGVRVQVGGVAEQAYR